MTEYIHIAGTNAKGSVAQYIAELLSAKYRCGLFTSPHIFSPEERFKINGEAISKPAYEEYLAREKKDPEEHLFIVWTRMAMRWFEDEKVDVAVIEAGIGGKNDCTNEIDSKLQIITPISYDHTEILGDTLAKIATEKCGIIKPGGTVITYPQAAEVMRVIQKTCDRMGAFLLELNKKDIKRKHADLSGQVFDFTYGGYHFKDLKISAISPAQVENACVSVMAAVEFGITDEDTIRECLIKAHLTGRVQAAGENIIIDGAHNVAATEELIKTIDKYYPGKKVTVLIAMMMDKDVVSITEKIAGFADYVVTTKADRKRGMPARELAGYFAQAKAIDDPTYAFMYALDLAKHKSTILVCCGSFYLVPKVLACDIKGF